MLKEPSLKIQQCINIFHQYKEINSSRTMAKQLLEGNFCFHSIAWGAALHQMQLRVEL